MRHCRIAGLAVLTFAVAFALASCKSTSTTGPKTTTSLAGSYSLLFITLPGEPTLSAPIATGTMAMTDSTYTVDIVIAVPGQQQQEIQDAGTYTVSGDSITQTSTVQNIQSVGTYTMSNDTLSVDVTTAGQEETTVWQKQ